MIPEEKEQPLVKPGIYRHYKGRLYEVLGVAKHSETHEPHVVYQALYDSPEFGASALWIRPLPSFIEVVQMEGKAQSRFEWIPESFALSKNQH